MKGKVRKVIKKVKVKVEGEEGEEGEDGEDGEDEPAPEVKKDIKSLRSGILSKLKIQEDA